MKKHTLLLFICIALQGCKSGKNAFISNESAAKNAKTSLFILNEHAKNAQNFETAIIKGAATYVSDSQNQDVGMDVQIEKDKQILINLRVKGFPVAKALITPDKIRYYSRLNNSFFEGDYAVLTRILGQELHYNQLQNLLLGQVLDSKSEDQFIASIENGLHKLSPTEQEDIRATYYFEDQNSLLKKEEITEVDTDRKLTISYLKHQKINDYIVPAEIHILAEQINKISLNLYYKKITFNEPVTIKYKVPTDFKRIDL